MKISISTNIVLRSACIAMAAAGCGTASAHTGSSEGWLHPLTGLDHFLAMVAVGAWSSQIGGRAIWFVPSAFVCCMFLGGLAGFQQFEIPGVEIGVALSVLVLGLAIGFSRLLPIFFASITVGIFGVFHGYAHGYEMPVMDNKLTYVAGFLATTAALHLIGAVGAYYLLKRPLGSRTLRFAGFACATCGLYLTAQASV